MTSIDFVHETALQSSQTGQDFLFGDLCSHPMLSSPGDARIAKVP